MGETIHDVVVIGAGPGGTATAHYLAKTGLDVLLVDKFDFPRDKTCGDALTPRAVAVLDDMGILGQLKKVGYRVNGVRIFAPKGHSLEVPFAPPESATGYALTVPRLTLDQLLLAQALTSGAKFQGHVHVTALIPDNDGITLKGEQRGKTYQAKAHMAVIATGANLKLPTRLGLLPHKPKLALAVRAYYENVSGLGDQILMRLHSLPQAGYGWIFPLSATSANIGAGIFPLKGAGRWASGTAHASFEAFVKIPLLQTMLQTAQPLTPLKGYPLRTDFGTAAVFGERTLLVGEAAGLVNPLTGDGIDFALESGRLAAQHLVTAFKAGDFSLQSGEKYSLALHQRYGELFSFCNRLRYLHLNYRFLNWVVTVGSVRSDLKMRLMNKLMSG